MGDEATWKTALKSEEVNPDDVQGVANTVVRHVTTTLARQAANMDTVSWPPSSLFSILGSHVGTARGVPSYGSFGSRPASQAME